MRIDTQYQQEEENLKIRVPKRILIGKCTSVRRTARFSKRKKRSMKKSLNRRASVEHFPLRRSSNLIVPENDNVCKSQNELKSNTLP